ncbi:hypothetical protein F5Y17DRAFT_412829 [Xylariaceae sp. FL0594]|nr:hypothetical protein F5Y17DRAFT_412829 [Xylariaceae sp. FL0594]
MAAIPIFIRNIVRPAMRLSSTRLFCLSLSHSILAFSPFPPRSPSFAETGENAKCSASAGLRPFLASRLKL